LGKREGSANKDILNSNLKKSDLDRKRGKRGLRGGEVF